MNKFIKTSYLTVDKFISHYLYFNDIDKISKYKMYDPKNGNFDKPIFVSSRVRGILRFGFKLSKKNIC